MSKVKLGDIDFERWVLGPVFIDKFAERQVLQELSPQDFYYEEHKEIFSAMLSLEREGVRVVIGAVGKILHDKGKLDSVGGIGYIHALAESFSNADFEYYLGQIKALSGKRQMIAMGHEMVAKASDPEMTTDALAEHFSKKITGIGTYSRFEFTPMKDIYENYKDGRDFLSVVAEECDRVAQGEDLFDGVRSYYPGLDSLIGGFARGTNNIIGARSSSGKTTFLSNLFMNIHQFSPKTRMGFFSLEMQKSRIMEKILCCMGGVNFKDLQERKVTVDGMGRLAKEATNIKSMNLSIFDRSGININEFKSYIRKETIRNGLDIVFLDYLSIIQAFHKTGNKHQEIDQVSKGLQSIALELNIPIVTLSQLNRNIYARQDKTPVLADLRESGSIEEDADLVMLLHRPIHYATNLAPVKEDVTQLLVAKNRLRGDLGKVEFEFINGRYYDSGKLEALRPNYVVNSDDSKPEYQPKPY